MTKHKDDDRNDDKILKDSERLRVPMLFMDQKTIDQKTAVLADGIPAGLHRPGFRYVSESPQARAARDAVYDAADAELSERWRNTAPGPITADDDAGPILNKKFDDEADPYAAYDQRIQNAWKGK